MQLSSLSSSSESTPNGRHKKRRAGVGSIDRAPSSVRVPIESRDIPAIEPSNAEVVSYIYKPVADLLGLIADSGVTDAASPATAPVRGSVLAANAAYKSSVHLADEELR